MSSVSLDSNLVTGLRMEICNCLSELDQSLDLLSRMSEEASTVMTEWMSEYTDPAKFLSYVSAQENLMEQEQQYNGEAPYAMENGEVVLQNFIQPAPGQRVLSSIPMPVSNTIAKGQRQGLKQDGQFQNIYAIVEPIILQAYLQIAPSWLSKSHHSTYIRTEPTLHYKEQPLFIYLRGRVMLYILLPIFTNKQLYTTLQQLLTSTDLPFAMQKQVLGTRRFLAGTKNIQDEHNPQLLTSSLQTTCPQLFPVVACRCMQELMKAYICGYTVLYITTQNTNTLQPYLTTTTEPQLVHLSLQTSVLTSQCALYSVLLQKEYIQRYRTLAFITAMITRGVTPSTLPIANLQAPTVIELISASEYLCDHIDASLTSSHQFYQAEVELQFSLLLALPRDTSPFQEFHGIIATQLYKAAIAHLSIHARIKCLKLLLLLVSTQRICTIHQQLHTTPYVYHHTTVLLKEMNITQANDHYLQSPPFSSSQDIHELKTEYSLIKQIYILTKPK